MSAAAEKPFPGEDPVKFRNRVLHEQGRIDIEWYYTPDRQMRLRHTGRAQSKLDLR